MTLLVTGATGHVGFAAVRRAARDGRRVLAQYRSKYDARDAASLPTNVAWVKCDITDAAAVTALAHDHGITACIHSAAVPNEAFARPAPLAAIEANIGATANLLEAARVGQWRRFVLVSTGSVFQLRKDTRTPILEDMPPQPANVYSTTKVAAEMLARMYRSEYGLSASAVRISWVYGPPLVTEHLMRGPIAAYLMRALKGETQIDGGGGDFAASFTYIEDVADGLVAAADAVQLQHELYHLGSGENYDVRRVAAAVSAAVPGTHIKVGAGTEPWTTYTAMRGPLAGDRLASDTGFKVSYSLERGIGLYADWLRKHPQT